MADDWETYNGDDQSLKCFKYFPSQQYATTAEKDCQALGGHLASIHSLEEKKFIDKMVTDDFWSEEWMSTRTVSGDGRTAPNGTTPTGCQTSLMARSTI